MNFAKPYEDLREFIDALDEHGKLYRIHREINKDSELQPLVRWQFRGGIAEEARRGFLFDNVTDGKKRKYNCRVLVSGLSGSEAIYCLGLKCQPDEVADRWIYAMDHLIEPIVVAVRLLPGRNPQRRSTARARRFDGICRAHVDAGLR